MLRGKKLRKRQSFLKDFEFAQVLKINCKWGDGKLKGRAKFMRGYLNGFKPLQGCLDVKYSKDRLVTVNVMRGLVNQ